MRNLKKIIALVAVFAMMVSTVAFAQDFTDVTEDHNYYEAIEMLSKLEILTGDDQDGDGKMDFRPEDTITRAEVAAIVSRIQNIDSAAQRATEFVDVPATHWASGYVAQAAGQGIVNGYGDGNFGPEDNVLYEQVVKMLMVTLGYEPFAKDNGGYPSGYLTAASRYGVTEGLIGANVGVEATRGQVAQLVYKAVDTALMDRYVYGDEKEYVIYDGVNRSYMSLLTRDLGVKKGSGIVTENAISTATGAKPIDKEEPVEIDIKWDGISEVDGEYVYSDDASNYKLWEVNTIYEADSNAGDYRGLHVNVFLKEANRNGDYDVISIAASNKNKVVTYDISDYADFDGDEVEFYTSTSKKVSVDVDDENSYGVSFNGIFYDRYTDQTVDTEGYEDHAFGYLVTADSKYSGSVTFVDNDKDSAYDVVSISIATVGVVDAVNANGTVDFKKNVYGYNKERVELDFEDEETLIKLTKDGETIEYTELKEWDVVAVYYPDHTTTEYYDVRVLASNAITSSVTGSKYSKTSAGNAGNAFLIDGTYYDVAANAYEGDSVKIGASGTFYIDEYEKIVAYDKTGGSVASDNYAYVLDAEMTDEDFNWGTAGVRALILDKNGEIYDVELASTVTLEYADEAAIGANLDGEDGDTVVESESVKVKDLTTSNLENLAEYMTGKVITFDVNSSKQLRTITFPQGDEDVTSLRLDDVSDADATYDEEEAELKVGRNTYTLTDDTVVFYVNPDETIDYLDGASVAKEFAKVGSYKALASNDYLTVAVFDTESDVPGAVVVFNTFGGISATTNVAVLAEDAGEAYVDGDRVVSVSYYMGGELRYSTLDPDADKTNIKDAEMGDVYKFTLNADGTVIEDYERYATGIARTESTTVDTAADYIGGGNGEDIFFGPIAKVDTGSDKLRLATWNTKGNDDPADDAWDFTSLATVKAENANVYVVDINRAKNEVYVGSIGNAEADEDIVKWNNTLAASELDTAKSAITFKEGYTTLTNVVPLGVMDYAFAVDYEDTVDVVIYKAYDFGRYTVEIVKVDAE